MRAVLRIERAKKIRQKFIGEVTKIKDEKEESPKDEIPEERYCYPLDMS